MEPFPGPFAETAARCPACGAHLLPGCPGGPRPLPACPGCGLPPDGPQAAELRWIEVELARLDDTARTLAARRGALRAAVLNQRSPAGAHAQPPLAGPPLAGPLPAGPLPVAASAMLAAAASGASRSGHPGPFPAQPAWSPPGAGPGRAWTPDQAPGAAAPAQRPELSHGAAAALMLAVGGTLVAIAAAVFTVVHWGALGTAGRAGVLLAGSAAVLAAAWPLRRRGLAATAEAVAGAGLAMTVGDAYLLLRLAGMGGPGPAAVAAASLAVAWLAHSRFAGVRGPRLVAIGAGQAVLPLAAAAWWPVPAAVGGALVLTSAADLGLRWASGGRGGAPERLAGAVAAISAWGLGVAVGGAAGLTPGGSVGPGVVLALAAAVALAGAPLMPAWLPQGPAAAAAGALAVPGLALSADGALPAGALAAGTLAAVAAAAAVAVAAGAWWWARWRPGDGPGWLAAGALAVLGMDALWVAPGVLAGLAGPAAWPGAGQGASAGGGWLAPGAGPGGAGGATVVLVLAALACWAAGVHGQALPWSRLAARWRWQAASVGAAALAAGSLPAALRLGAWGTTAALATSVAVLLALAASQRQPMVAAAAGGGGLLLAGFAAWWSLTGAAATIAGLAALTLIFASAAWRARTGPAAALAAGAAMVAAAGLAGLAPPRAGAPSGGSAWAVLGVAVATVAAATALRRARPLVALVLDAGAGPVAVLAALLAVPRPGAFSVLATAAAVAASATAWLRDGRRRAVAAAGAVLAGLAALGPRASSLAGAAAVPLRWAGQPWHGLAEAGAFASRVGGLPLTVTVLAACGAAGVVAAGAWRGARGSLDALAAALPVVAAPAGAACGLGYQGSLALLLALAVLLAVWAAASGTLAPAAAALTAASLAVTWALAASAATMTVLGCLALTYLACAWLGRRVPVRVGAAVLTVTSAAAFAQAGCLAAGLAAWQAGFAVLAVAAATQAAAALAARSRPLDGAVIAIAGWLAVCAGVAPSLAAAAGAAAADAGSPMRAAAAHAGLALAAAAAICLATAARPDRRRPLWAGLVLAEAALCLGLAAAGVGAPEPYTVPAALIVLGHGHGRWRRGAAAGSWAAYGPGLALLLVPSLAASWLGDGWVRPLLLGVAAAWLTVAGARARLAAPALLGSGTAVADAARQLAPVVGRLAGVMPRWAPIAATGMVLIVIGATYEARRRDLARIRVALTRLR